MKQQLFSLADVLIQIQQPAEANLILKLAQQEDIIKSWENLLLTCQSPIDPNILSKSFSYMFKGAKNLVTAAAKLQSLSSQQIESLVNMSSNMPGVKTSAGFNDYQMLKYSKQFNELFPNQEFSHIKVAQVSQLVSETGSNIVERQHYKLVPYIGVIFSAIFALKYLTYGFIEFSRLVGNAPTVGLSWQDTLFPERLRQKVSEFNDQPDMLIKLTELIKISKEFISNFISTIGGSIDMVKDLILTFVNIASLGASIFVDLGLSLIIAVIEYFTEQSALEEHNNVINEITSLAVSKIKSFENLMVTQETQTQNLSELSDEDLFNYYNT